MSPRFTRKVTESTLYSEAVRLVEAAQTDLHEAPDDFDRYTSVVVKLLQAIRLINDIPRP